MIRTIPAAALLLFCTQSALTADDAPPKTTVVNLKGLTLTVPENWTQAASRSSMRLATFEIPAVDGDEGPAELAIYSFPGGGGPVDSNISRWIGQFDNKDRDAKITKGKAGDSDYYMVEVTGTYNQAVGPPIRRQTKAIEGSRMLAVILQLDQGVYFLKLTGKDKTVKAQSKPLRQSFGGSVESEKEYQE